jgi:hypothetical protein
LQARDRIANEPHLPCGVPERLLLFQKAGAEFSQDLIRNLYRTDVESRYSERLGRPLVETDIKVRSTIGHQTYHATDLTDRRSKDMEWRSSSF